MGKVDPELVDKAEKKLSTVFIDLALRYDNLTAKSGLGGDPLIFGLMYPVQHICTLSMPTAATDGKRFYWNPNFVLNHSVIGLRLIAAHEAWHALYMHPSRRGSRNPKLWNIAVDYIVNGVVMEDLEARDSVHEKRSYRGEGAGKRFAVDMFNEHLGQFLTIPQYIEYLQDPVKYMKDNNWDQGDEADDIPLPALDDHELTEEELDTISRKAKRKSFFFADPDIEQDLKSPEKIYDLLFSKIPKCPECGRLGYYPDKKNQNNQDSDESDDKSDNDDKSKSQSKDEKDESGSDDEKSDSCCGHDHGDEKGGSGQDSDNQDGCDHDGCGTCHGKDIFGFGATVDEHMDSTEDQEKLAKRIHDAMRLAQQQAGRVPQALEDELGKLTQPTITWQDVLRTTMKKSREGNNRNDWNRFRSRAMFYGMLLPKRKSYSLNFACLLDTSGSMSNEDMAFGISQLAALDEQSEGWIIPADADIYWDQATKIRKANAEELSKVKVVGRGGTVFGNFTSDYEEHVGKCDFLIFITDGYLYDGDVAAMVDPGIPVVWLITSDCKFDAPFGSVYKLRA